LTASITSLKLLKTPILRLIWQKGVLWWCGWSDWGMTLVSVSRRSHFWSCYKKFYGLLSRLSFWRRCLDGGNYVTLAVLKKAHLEVRAKSQRLCWLLCRSKWADKKTLEDYFCEMTLKLKCVELILSFMIKINFTIQLLRKLTSLNWK
jgi:hypothetical protein